RQEEMARTLYETTNNGAMIGIAMGGLGEHSIKMDTLYSPPQYGEPKWGETVYHPLYSLCRARAETAIRYLLSREPTLVGEESWKFVTEHFSIMEKLLDFDDDDKFYGVALFYKNLLEVIKMEKELDLRIKEGLTQWLIGDLISLIRGYSCITVEDLPKL